MTTEAPPVRHDFSGGNHLAEFLSHLPDFSSSIGFYDEFDPSRLNMVLSEVRHFLKDYPCAVNQRKRVYSMAVECFDNIRNYYTVTNMPLRPSLLAFTVEGEHFCITAGNLISKKDEYDLRERLEMLEQLNRKELNKELTETILMPGNKKVNGAGLGLIMMGWRSGNFVDHHFEDRDSRNTFFYIRIKIPA